VLRINRAKAVHFNIQPEEMIGKTDYDYFSKEHADKAFAEEQALIRSGTPMINIEERALLNSGDIVWASTSRIPFKNGRNEIVGMFIITKDVTKQKVAEASIQDRERIIEHLLDSMPVFRYRIDKDGTVSQLWKSKALRKFDPQMFEYKHVKDCMPEVYDLLDQKDLQDVDLIGKGVINVGGEMEIFKHYLFKDSSYEHVYYGFAIKQ
jgi:PAS domain S-box-containing protein